eukprot:TRINITY_DN38747_c0_g1_i1.p1 TRINITY_DN38747_c0_g1~~TRINITY_DN38747_c0_g1_i1.p1  ORF type:complete len:284 (+),score=37.61 TRINITY_DN38747_c0_g1_i1:127-978(+)
MAARRGTFSHGSTHSSMRNVGAEDKKAMFFRTTLGDLDGRRPDKLAMTRSMADMREQWPLPPEAKRSSALDPNYMTSRVEHSGRQSIDFEMNRQLAADFRPQRKAMATAMYVKASTYADNMKGPVGEELKRSKPEIVDVNDNYSLGDLCRGKSLVTKSFASSQYLPPPPGHPTKDLNCRPTLNLDPRLPPRALDFYRSTYQREHCDAVGGSQSACCGVAARSRSGPSLRGSGRPLLAHPPPTPGGHHGGREWYDSIYDFDFKDPSIRRQLSFAGPGRATIVTQ